MGGVRSGERSNFCTFQLRNRWVGRGENSLSSKFSLAGRERLMERGR
jgi:hypothetical protein